MQKKPKPTEADKRAEARQSIMGMLANPTPMNNVAAVGADMAPGSSSAPKVEVVEPQVVEEAPKEPVLVAQTEVKDEVAPAPVTPQQVAEPAPVAQVKEPVPAQPQPTQESAPVSDSPQHQMAAAMVAMMFKDQLNPEFLKESNVSTPLDPVRAQLLKLAGTLTKKSQKLIMTEALDMWLKSHGFVQPPQ